MEQCETLSPPWAVDNYTTGREKMEKQKPFKLFVPPRLSSSQVSAVKPQTSGGDSNFFKVNLHMNFDLIIL